MLTAFLSDLRQGARALLRAPTFAALSVAILGVGLGAVTVAFALIHGVLLEPLPWAEPDRLHEVRLVQQAENGSYEASRVPVEILKAWRDELGGVVRTVASEEARHETDLFVTGGLEPVHVRGAFVSNDWFGVLGSEPALGRTFLQNEQDPHVAVISAALWRSVFGTDAGAIGRTLQLNGVPYIVIGIMATDFEAPPPVSTVETGERIDVYAPIAVLGPRRADDPHDRALVRLEPGVTKTQAEEAMAHIAISIAKAQQVTGIRLEPVRDVIVGPARTPLGILAAVVGLTLLLTCANVSGVQLARFSARRHEVAVRIALGASRRRVFAHYLAEGIVLALAGGTAGLLLSLWGQDMVRAIAPTGFPRLEGVTVGAPVFVFAFGVALLAGFVATVWPAAAVARTRASIVRAAGIAGTGQPNRARRILVLTQIVIAMTLLSGSGILVRTMQRLRNVETGVTSLDVMVFDLHRRRDAAGPVAPEQFYAAVLERVTAEPGVEGVTLASSVPFRARDYYGPEWRRRIVHEGYFEALGIPLLAGRTFDERDRQRGEPVAVVSERLVREQFGGRSPIGALFDDVRVIGVVADVRHQRPDEPAAAAMYLPFAQNPDSRMSLIVHADLPPSALVPAVRRAVRGVDADQPIGTIATLRQMLDRSDAVARRRFHLRVLVMVALFAALLASLGVYGVAAQTVVTRTPEIGVRVALGATRSDVASLILSGTGRLILTGIALGWIAALGFGRVLASALFEVSPGDPLVLSIAAALLVATALLASALPAHRATRIDPAHALRRS